VIDSLEQLGLECEAVSFAFVWINYLFEGEQILPHTLVPHQVDRAKTTFAEQFLDLVASAYNTSDWKNFFYLLHNAPRTMC